MGFKIILGIYYKKASQNHKDFGTTYKKTSQGFFTAFFSFFSFCKLRRSSFAHVSLGWKVDLNFSALFLLGMARPPFMLIRLL